MFVIFERKEVRERLTRPEALNAKRENEINQYYYEPKSKLLLTTGDDRRGLLHHEIHNLPCTTKHLHIYTCIRPQFPILLQSNSLYNISTSSLI